MRTTSRDTKNATTHPTPEATPGAREPARRRSLFLVLMLLAGTALAQWLTQSTLATPDAGGLPVDRSASSGTVTLHGRLDRTAVVAGGDGTVSLELTLEAAAGQPSKVRSLTDLVVVLDRSGSMDGAKIQEARRAVHGLVDRLTAGDRFALVSYSSDARVDLALAVAGEGTRQAWHQQINQVRVGGGTNLSAGIDLAMDLLARREAGRSGRLLVISDGLANEGDSSQEGLVGRATAVARRELVMSAIGVGLDFNEFLLAALADAGSGNFYFLEDGQQLAAVLGGELEAGRSTVAEAVAVTLEPAPGVRVLDAGGYPLESLGGGMVLRPGDLFAGQQRKIWVRLEVPVGRPGQSDLGAFRMSWREAGEHHQVALPDLPQVACVRDGKTALASIDRSVWEKGVQDETYGALRQEVARYVREGKRDEALDSISRFRDEIGLMNQAVASPTVAATLDEAAELEAEVDDAFVGADQDAKQNVLSKKEQAAGWDSRRQGSKMLPVSEQSEAQDANDGKRR